MSMKLEHHNTKVAKARGKRWLENIRAARLDVQLNPSTLRIKRLEKGISQEEMADLLHTSVSTYTAIERGKRLVKEESAKTISSTVKVPLSLLFKSDKPGKFLAKK